MKKKIVSLMLTGVLFASMSLTAFATDGTAPGSTEVKTEGSVNYVDTTVYEVTLPTSSCFNFIVDPQGILSATAPDTYTPDLYPTGTAGYIVATEGTGAYVNNKSSVPIKLTVDAYVESDDATGAASSAKLLGMEEYDLINSGIDNSMILTFDITNEDVFYNADGEYKPEDFIDESLITAYTVNPYVIAITQNGSPEATGAANGTQISFALDKAEYAFNGDSGNYTYDRITGETGDSVGMRLSGFVNTNADWSAFTGDTAEKIIVKTVFDFDKLSTDYDLAAFDKRAHGVLADIAPVYFAGLEYDENGELTGATAAGEMEYVVGKGALEIPFDFGTGTEEIEVTAVSVNGADIAATDYKVNNYVISLKSTETNVKDAMDAATPEGTPVPVVITTSDGQATTITVTMYK